MKKIGINLAWLIVGAIFLGSWIQISTERVIKPNDLLILFASLWAVLYNLYRIGEKSENSN